MESIDDCWASFRRQLLTHAIKPEDDPEMVEYVEYLARTAYFLGALAQHARVTDACATQDPAQVSLVIAESNAELAEFQQHLRTEAGHHAAAVPDFPFTPPAEASETDCPRCSAPMDDLDTIHRCPACYATRPR